MVSLNKTQKPNTSKIVIIYASLGSSNPRVIDDVRLGLFTIGTVGFSCIGISVLSLWFSLVDSVSLDVSLISGGSTIKFSIILPQCLHFFAIERISSPHNGQAFVSFGVEGVATADKSISGFTSLFTSNFVWHFGHVPFPPPAGILSSGTTALHSQCNASTSALDLDFGFPENLQVVF